MWKRLRAWVRKYEHQIYTYRHWIIAGGIVVLVLLIFFGTQLALYVNLLLGNDVLVRLETSEHEIATRNAERTSITFTASVATNPFCTASCAAVFEDASAGRILAKEAFTIRTGDPYERTYEIATPSEGEGIDLYQYHISCTSNSTLLCRTSEIETQRSALITNEYTLSDEQAALKSQTRSALEEIDARLESLDALENTSQTLLTILENYHAIESPPAAEMRSLQAQRAQLEQFWSEQHFAQALTLAGEMRGALDREEVIADRRLASLTDQAAAHDAILEQLTRVEEFLTAARADLILNASLAGEIDALTRTYNSQLEPEGTLAAHQRAVDELATAARTVSARYVELQREDALRARIAAHLLLDARCTIDGLCPTLPDPRAWLAVNGSVRSACLELVDARVQIFALAASGETQNASIALNETRKQILLAYRDAAQESWQDGILSALIAIIPDESASASTAALRGALIASAPPACVPAALNSSLRERSLDRIGEVVIPQREITPPEEPQSRCCLAGVCSVCPTSEPDHNYPIVFVHGHAFNKDTLAEYSLDAFNQMQDAFEEDGYLDAGAISPQTNRATLGTLSRIPAPVSFQSTYYLDVFQGEHDYVIVQGKSENLDTYALRLNEVLSHVRARTGKEKVILIAHSMGGLVARRYVQIFGPEHVAGLIMIGTPNHGLAAEESRWCTIIGEQLECRDMDSQSLFLNKLNRDPPSVPSYVVIGSGCAMAAGDGDGVVIVESAKVVGATNVIVNGSCEGITTLHTEMLFTKEYPQTYDLVSSFVAELQR